MFSDMKAHYGRQVRTLNLRKETETCAPRFAFIGGSVVRTLNLRKETETKNTSLIMFCTLVRTLNLRKETETNRKYDDKDIIDHSSNP